MAVGSARLGQLLHIGYDVGNHGVGVMSSYASSTMILISSEGNLATVKDNLMMCLCGSTEYSNKVDEGFM